MHVVDLLRLALAEAEKVGLDAMDAMGHPIVVVGTEGDRIGQVADVKYVNGELQLGLSAG